MLRLPIKPLKIQKYSAEEVSSSQATKVDLSSRAQDIKNIKSLANQTPDVDTAKVEKFKKLIAEGNYKVDAKAVADRMVDEHLMTLQNGE